VGTLLQVRAEANPICISNLSHVPLSLIVHRTIEDLFFSVALSYIFRIKNKCDI